MKHLARLACLISAVLLTLGCGRHAPAGDGASAATLKANAQFSQQLNLDDPKDFEDASRGFIARPTGQLLGADGRVLEDFDAFQFEAGPAPPTVNPSLWRHAQLDAKAGLFKVTDGVFQLRGFDLANMTLVEGRTGWIVVDPLTCRESAATALAFARKHLGDRPVSAVFTHSHMDHFGGIFGVLGPREAADRKVPVVASEGFMEEATSENVLAGPAMGRRSAYQFGKNLPRTALGNVDTGLGKGVAYGHYGILAPTRLVKLPTEEVSLDGVRFVFHNVPGAEAPAELTFALPERKVYCGAENLVQTMHNLLPVRGAKVRDALRWSTYMQLALDQLGDAEVCISQHNWPIWGQDRIREFITMHRDVYKYIHDQTVRLINAGATPDEIASTLKLPASLAAYPGARGYYGDLRQNARAVYQFYMGFYDGNPAHLDRLPPKDLGRRYVEAMGGADATVALARKAFDQGDYRWAVELLNHVALGQSGHQGARDLLARAYDQLGYQSESATWRNSYLTAAQELRNGPPRQGVDRKDFIDMLMQTPVERFLEAMAAGLDGPAAEGKRLKINLVLTDTRETFVLWIENAVLHFKPAAPAADAQATLTLTKALFIRMMAGTAGVKDTLLSSQLQVQGSRIDLVRFFTLIDKAPGTFPIVTP